MIWFFLAAALLLVAAFVFRSKHPQRAFIGAVVAIALCLGSAALYVVERRVAPPPEIAVADLELEGVEVSADRYGAQVRGRIANRSTARLGTMTLAVTYRQCPGEGPCSELGAEEIRLFLGLAGGQTSGFSALLGRGDLAARAGVRADVRLTGARADF